ncbi:SapB/AmfS family lanthipeptide [Streptomyces melanogenes]|uniref:SapB/AmfS family lanthipeptide n=1 Tax=Streptomyces melanogenes TaxID=67326 RepID=UPI003570B1AB
MRSEPARITPAQGRGAFRRLSAGGRWSPTREGEAVVLLDLQALTLQDAEHASTGAAGSAGSVFFCNSSVTVIFCCVDGPVDR